MRDGLYRYVDKDDATNYGEYVIKVRETPKSYVFERIKNDMRFSPAHLDMMFENSDRVTISKTRSPHAINTIDDDWYSLNPNWFCIYPYRAGIPYVFEQTEEHNAKNN